MNKNKEETYTVSLPVFLVGLLAFFIGVMGAATTLAGCCQVDVNLASTQVLCGLALVIVGICLGIFDYKLGGQGIQAAIAFALYASAIAVLFMTGAYDLWQFLCAVYCLIEVNIIGGVVRILAIVILTLCTGSLAGYLTNKAGKLGYREAEEQEY